MTPDLESSAPAASSFHNAIEGGEVCPGPPTTAAPEHGLTWQIELQIFLSTFLTIFLAEVGDKTQLTVLLMSAQSGSPWTIFLGAASALIATTLCGVLLGRWLSTRIAPKVLDKSAAVLLLLIAALLLWDVWQS